MMSSYNSKLWDAVVITCSDHESALVYEEECAIRQKSMFIHPKTTVLSVVDPAANIGSGGATINAIVHVTEYISALEGHTVISSGVLEGKKILILHMGTMTPYSACSPGFLCVTDCNEAVITQATQLDALFQRMNRFAKDSPPGFWVCSGDRLISFPENLKPDWNDNSVYLLTVPVKVETVASEHGVAKLNEDGTIADIMDIRLAEKDSCCQLDNGEVPIISGIVFFKTLVIESLLTKSVFHPLVLWTYLGIDSGSEPNERHRPFASERQGVHRSDKKNILLSLYFDVLLCMASNVTKDDYVLSQHDRSVFGTAHLPDDFNTADVSLRRSARQVLWDIFNEFKIQAVQLYGGEFQSIFHDLSTFHQTLLKYSHHKAVQSILDVRLSFKPKLFKRLDPNEVLESCAIINSLVSSANIGKDTVVLNSKVEENVFIGSNSMVINLSTDNFKVLLEKSESFRLPDNIVLESLYVNFVEAGNTVGKARTVLLMFGIFDKLQSPVGIKESTIFNQSWKTFFERTSIVPDELWESTMSEESKCLLNAKLFPLSYPNTKMNNEMDIMPLLWLQGTIQDDNLRKLWRSSQRLSFQDILNMYNAKEEFLWRQSLYFETNNSELEKVVTGRNCDKMDGPFLRSQNFEIGKRELENALKEKKPVYFLPFFQTSIADGFFEELLETLDNVIKTSEDASVMSRAFACIADVLGCKAENQGGLRSGPAANHLWKKGLTLLEEGKVNEAVDAMATQRKQWSRRNDLLVRSARHYEGAFQILVRKAVSTARQFIQLVKMEAVPLNTWVAAKAPGRLDWSGGWSDTPPLSYDMGGKVVTFALQLSEKKPIGCRVKRIAEPKIVLVMGLTNPTVVECKEFYDFSDYSSPNAPGALLKASFYCTNILPLSSPNQSLSDYLLDTHKGGFVLQSWSDLPKGSGLGTSSILAGCILSALWKAVGLQHEVSSVLHAVLDLEQMLTTGGGWQDQVGGLCPGIKVCTSKNRLPLQVQTRPIKTPDGFIEKLNKHLVVVFTGKTRLARNMLQDVLRNWNARSPDIMKTAASLISNANETIQALEEGNLELVGKCLNDCWINKKKMAHGCETSVCRQIMDQLSPHVLGVSMAGAGGGGFMCMITKEGNAAPIIREEIEKLKISGKPTAHSASIDQEGLVVTIDDDTNDLMF